MKRTILLLALIVVTYLAQAQPEIGSKVPEIALQDIHGQTIPVSSLLGKVVVIDFWASWCRPCRQAIKEMRPIYKKYKDKGFEVYGISIDENEKAWKYAIANDKAGWIHVRDKDAASGDELMQTWGIRYIPTTFVLDKEGRLVAVNPENNELEKLLKKLL